MRLGQCPTVLKGLILVVSFCGGGYMHQQKKNHWAAWMHRQSTFRAGPWDGGESGEGMVVVVGGRLHKDR
jgi:hypothetical protein